MEASLEPRVAVNPELFQQVFRFALSVCRKRELAEDLAQEAICKAMKRNMAKELESDDLRKWLFRVAFNLWLDEKRKLDRRPISSTSIESISAEQLTPQESFDQRAEIDSALQWMQELPDRQRQVLHLKTVEEFSIDQIAETLGMSRGAVKTNLSIARKRMRERLAQNQERSATER